MCCLLLLGTCTHWRKLGGSAQMLSRVSTQCCGQLEPLAVKGALGSSPLTADLDILLLTSLSRARNYFSIDKWLSGYSLP